MKKILIYILLGFLLTLTQPVAAKENTIVEFTDSNYLSKLLTSDKPVLVKFWAPWCRACKKMSPEYNKAAQTMKGKVVFAKVNVDTQKQLSQIYQIRGIPALILFEKNKMVNKHVGSLKQEQIEGFVKHSLK
jgi:thioredoxin